MKTSQLLAHFDRISDAPDAIQNFRQFVLDLAVRGKLVEQDPRDESALKLLVRVQAEKVRLVKEGKIRKQSLPQIGSSEYPFSLPVNWTWVRFGEIADFSAGKTPSRSEFSYWNSIDYPWVSIGDMKDGEDVLITREGVSEIAKKVSVYRPSRGLRRDGSPDGMPGRDLFFPWRHGLISFRHANLRGTP